MAFAKGTSVFNSCNKAGAVVHFTSHLASNPNDWNALMWRAQAYSILGQNQNAINDLDRAIEVGRGVQRKLAMAEKKEVIGSDMSECLGFLKQITDEHPDCWEAYFRYGSLQKRAGDGEGAIKSLRAAIDIAVDKGEFYNPYFCWISLALGQLWFDKGEIGVAINYFMDSVRSSPTHTISYIHLCHMHIMKGEFVKAREYFETANGLNPTLVKEIFKFDSFYDYLKDLNEKLQAAELQRQQSSSTGNLGYQPVSSVPVPAAPQVHKSSSTGNLGYQPVSSVPVPAAPQVHKSYFTGNAGYQPVSSVPVPAAPQIHKSYFTGNPGYQPVSSVPVPAAPQIHKSYFTGKAGYQPVNSLQVSATPKVQQYGNYTSVGQWKAPTVRNQTYREASNDSSVLQGQLSNASGGYEGYQAYKASVSQGQPRSLSACAERAKYSSSIYSGKPKTGYGESELQKDFSNKLNLLSQASNSSSTSSVSHVYRRTKSADSDRQKSDFYPSHTTQAANSDNYEVQPVFAGKSKKRTPKAVPTSSKGERNYSSGATGSQGGNGGGHGGDGGGSGSDDDDDNPFSGMNVSEIWKKLQKESSNIKMYGKHKYVQSKCGNYWYSKDTAGHAAAAFKRYTNTKSYLIFRDALDAKMRPMTDKHESREGTSIKKSEMVGVRGK